MIESNLSEQAVKKNLRLLKEKKIIDRIGGVKKGGYWKVND